MMKNLSPILIAVSIGTLGGLIFSILNLPLPWMLGSMVFVTGAAISGCPLRLPFMLRQCMVVFIGVMLGSQFTPELLDKLLDWTLSVGAMLAYIILTMLLVLAYLHKLGKYDPITSYFSAAPGGLNDMTIIGGEMGGDERIIALTQASRILFVVLTIPFMFRIFGGYTAPDGLLPEGPGFDLPLSEWIVIVISVTLGPFIARRLRLPAAYLLGSLILTATAHISGWASSSPPVALVAIAQIILGTAVGCRFSGTKPMQVLRIIKISIGSTFILMSTAVAGGLLVSELTGLPWYLITLAYAPGGLAEMSLVAFGIGQDVPFVATHHLCRIGIIVLLAPLAFKLIHKYLSEKPK
ncbi:MAG: ammonia monooxygenase [Rhodospirillaceae bacterium]|nr:ammonia monooxygenase [Rhodospirillaceae bacterium]|tara:strand:- start:631 stop:1686 length:1056 start_codon:yes stop_codon:yes gene_type:complete